MPSLVLRAPLMTTALSRELPSPPSNVISARLLRFVELLTERWRQAVRSSSHREVWLPALASRHLAYEPAQSRQPSPQTRYPVSQMAGRFRPSALGKQRRNC